MSMPKCQCRCTVNEHSQFFFLSDGLGLWESRPANVAASPKSPLTATMTRLTAQTLPQVSHLIGSRGVESFQRPKESAYIQAWACILFLSEQKQSYIKC